jgi:hypothetical protein
MAWHPVKKTLAIGFSSMKQKKKIFIFFKKIFLAFVRRGINDMEWIKSSIGKCYCS